MAATADTRALDSVMGRLRLPVTPEESEEHRDANRRQNQRDVQRMHQRRKASRHHAPFKEEYLLALGDFKTVTIPMWQADGYRYLGWMSECPVEVPVQIVYQERRTKGRRTVAQVEEVLFKLTDISAWPSAEKFWMELARKFREQTGLSLFGIRAWARANRPW